MSKNQGEPPDPHAAFFALVIFIYLWISLSITLFLEGIGL